MADGNAKAKAAQKSWWQGMKEEFAKIIWPTREATTKQTVAVVVVSVIVGLLIALLDAIIQFGINFLIGL